MVGASTLPYDLVPRHGHYVPDNGYAADTFTEIQRNTSDPRPNAAAASIGEF